MGRFTVPHEGLREASVRGIEFAALIDYYRNLSTTIDYHIPRSTFNLLQN
ncbi:MAG: hypothetical protein PF904_05720 [Kiritimatiellae bacterium]|nr:hypothetical protein [Kiritimatiellia bacterium]